MARIRDEEPEEVPDLPEPENVVKGETLPACTRKCPKCGGEARIVSNEYGVQAYCGPCRYDWPVSNSGSYPPFDAPLPPRGIRKVSLV